MTSIRPILRISKKNKKGECPLVIRVTSNRKSRYVYIGERVEEKYWNSEAQEVRKTHSKSVKINAKLKKTRRELEEAEETIERQYGIVSAEEIVNRTTIPNKNIYFDDFCNEHLELLKKRGSIARYKADFPRLGVIQKFNQGNKLHFHKITVNYLDKFIVYLKTERAIKSQATINNYLGLIKTVYNIAIYERVVDKELYPFVSQKVKLKKVESLKVPLQKEEIEAIMDLDLPYGSKISHVRNVWLFSFAFAGVRVGDVLKLRWNNIEDFRLGYRMNKNDKSGLLKIFQIGNDILEYYRPEKFYDSNQFIFPEFKGFEIKNDEQTHLIVTNATRLFNKYLKKVAKMANIDKNLSMHIARHSFANHAVKMGAKVTTLKKLLRHSDIATTMKYIENFMQEDTDDDMEKIMDPFEGKDWLPKKNY